jgi:hypothetical protein
MPIGKNSIKRVANNGYSKVSTSAPDMDNSTVVEQISTSPAPKKASESAPKTSAKAEPKTSDTSAKKIAKPSSKKAETVKSTPKAAPVSKKEELKTEKGYCNFGDELPVYLL